MAMLGQNRLEVKAAKPGLIRAGASRSHRGFSDFGAVWWQAQRDTALGRRGGPVKILRISRVPQQTRRHVVSLKNTALPDITNKFRIHGPNQSPKSVLTKCSADTNFETAGGCRFIFSGSCQRRFREGDGRSPA
jgi:hypothetical protein